eukprot:3208147-Amphidinium_carterae.1
MQDSTPQTIWMTTLKVQGTARGSIEKVYTDVLLIATRAIKITTWTIAQTGHVDTHTAPVPCNTLLTR